MLVCLAIFIIFYNIYLLLVVQAVVFIYLLINHNLSFLSIIDFIN